MYHPDSPSSGSRPLMTAFAAAVATLLPAKTSALKLEVGNEDNEGRFANMVKYNAGLQERNTAMRDLLHGFRIAVSTLVGVLLVALSASAMAVEKSPQERAAMPSRLAAISPLLAVASAGERIVAVGQRGHILTSDDSGKRWIQAKVPVSTDLLAVSFPSPKQGWAVGHGGVVLHSSDGGSTWTKQLDGRQAAVLAVRYFESKLAAGAPVEQLLEREKSLISGGGTQALLDVYFESDSTGYVVGTFNRIYRTDDGGQSWTPWMDRTDNPKELHFYAIRGGRHGLYLAGEQGMVWRFDAAKQRFAGIKTPYNGTLFGLVIDGPHSLLVFGMRGSLFRTINGGNSWDRIPTGSPAGITSGTVLPDGAIVVVSQAGGISLSRDHGTTFASAIPSSSMPYFGVAALGGKRIGVAGPEGVKLETIQ